MAIKEENIEWTERSLELLLSQFEPLKLTLEERITISNALKKDWANEDTQERNYE